MDDSGGIRKDDIDIQAACDKNMSQGKTEKQQDQHTWTLNIQKARFRLLHKTFQLVLFSLGFERRIKQVNSKRLAKEMMRDNRSEQAQTYLPLWMF